MSNLIPHFIHEQFQQGRRRGAFQAAALFVDISGFTPLTETLMQRRKDEAELLGEAINEIFGPLVKQVHERGGIIPLFAGDAFTALFPHDPDASPDAPLHALMAAFFVQGFLSPERRHRILSTSYGEFAIGVKAGLSYGTVKWGIPGYRDRYCYYFRGEALQGCAEAQRHAAQGEITADDRILPYLQQHVVALPLPHTALHRLTACTLELQEPGVMLPPLSRRNLSPFISNAVLDFKARAEYREICPVFVSFEEPGDTRSLHRFLLTAMRLTDSYGGTFSQIDFGDKGALLVIWFGAPISYENNAERAAQFLLALRHAAPPQRWRAGFTSGIVWAGLRGSHPAAVGGRCEFGAIGDSVNLAARLCLKADWGELWVSAPAYQQLKERYWADARGKVRLKGKTGEIPVFRLWGKREQIHGMDHSGAMVGRESELDQLTEWVEPILRGQFAGVISVSGEAGIGKSRLVDELRLRLTRRMGVRWFLCPADDILHQSLNPFKRFIRRHFDQSRDLKEAQNRLRFDAILDGIIADLQMPPSPSAGQAPNRRGAEIASELERTRSFLASLAGLRWSGSLHEQLEPQLRYENTLAAFKTLILAESLRRPVVLQLDDLQWFDTASKELTTLLTRNVEGFPVAVITTSRCRDDGSRIVLDLDPGIPQNVLELEVLETRSIGALAAQMLGSEISDSLLAFLAERTNGNPFFVEQVVLDLQERRMLAAEGGEPWTLVSTAIVEVPATINAVLIARLDRLAAQIREVVQTAAVLGREFSVKILSRMLRGEEWVLDTVHRAEHERIWSALGEFRYVFRHALLRDAAYEMQLRARLRALHLLAAHSIEEVYPGTLAPHYADLVYHYSRAEEPEREREYACLAGEQAATQFANRQALQFLGRALELMTEEETPEGSRERFGILLILEEVHGRLGDRQAQAHDLAALERLALQLVDERLKAEVCLLKGHLLEATGDYQTATAEARAAIGAAQASQDTLRTAEGHLIWGRALWRQGSYEQARHQLEEALRLAASARSQEGQAGFERPQPRVRRPGSGSSLAIEADCLRSLGAVHWHLGEFEEHTARNQEALRLYRELGDRSGEATALSNLAISSGQRHDLSQAQKYLEESLRIQREIGDRRGEAHALNNLGVVYRNLGDSAKARDYYRLSLRLKRETGDRRGAVSTLINLGIVVHNQGVYSEAQAYYEESLQLCREIGNRFGERSALDYLALLAHQLGENETAVQHARASLALSTELGERHIQDYALTYLGHGLTELGQLAEATDVYSRALALRREAGRDKLATEPLAGLARICVLREDLSGALSRVEEILHYLETGTLEGTTEPSRTYLTCYRLLNAVSDPRALDVLTAGYHLLQQYLQKLSDTALRSPLLENVVANREIVAAYESLQSKSLSPDPGQDQHGTSP